MDDREGWRERVRNIRADSATWWGGPAGMQSVFSTAPAKRAICFGDPDLSNIHSKIKIPDTFHLDLILCLLTYYQKEFLRITCFAFSVLKGWVKNLRDFNNMRCNLLHSNAFVCFLKGANHSGLWDAQLTWYSLSTTLRIWIYCLDHGFGINIRSTWPYMIVEFLATWAKFLEPCYSLGFRLANAFGYFISLFKFVIQFPELRKFACSPMRLSS